MIVKLKEESREVMADFLRSIFQEMVSMDTLILQMMNQAQKLVKADRASLFLVDNKNKQLYARCVCVLWSVLRRGKIYNI